MQIQTAERKGVCGTGVEGISEDNLDCRLDAGHGNGPDFYFKFFYIFCELS